MDANVGIIAGATIGGALAGGGIAFGTTVWIERRKACRVKQGFIRLLINDIESLWKLYYELLGRQIKKHNERKVFTYSLGVKQDYFSVFNNNSDKILYLDDKTSKSVVQFYNRAKAHSDMVSEYHENLTHYYNLQGPEQKTVEADLKELFKRMSSDYEKLGNMRSRTVSKLKKDLKTMR